MESRRIQQVGERSFSVTLPKWWVEERKLRQHDLIFMDMVPNGDLTVSARQVSTQRKHMEIHASEVDSLPEFIILCYVKSIQSVRISGHLDYKEVSDIKKTLGILEGYTITSENEKGIEISFMFGDINITIDIIIQRMVYLLKLSLAAAERGDHANLESFETSINRLQNLSKRIMGATMTDSSLRNANGIHDQDTVFFLRMIAKRLESIGNRISAIIDHKMPKEEMKLTASLLELLERILLRNEQPAVLKAEFSRLRAQVKSQNGLLRMFDLSEDILEGQISIIYNKKYFS